MSKTLHDEVALSVLPVLLAAELQNPKPSAREVVARALAIADSYCLQRAMHDEEAVRAPRVEPNPMEGQVDCVGGFKRHRWDAHGRCERPGCHGRCARWYIQKIGGQRARRQASVVQFDREREAV